MQVNTIINETYNSQNDTYIREKKIAHEIVLIICSAWWQMQDQCESTCVFGNVILPLVCHLEECSTLEVSFCQALPSLLQFDEGSPSTSESSSTSDSSSSSSSTSSSGSSMEYSDSDSSEWNWSAQGMLWEVIHEYRRVIPGFARFANDLQIDWHSDCW